MVPILLLVLACIPPPRPEEPRSLFPWDPADELDQLDGAEGLVRVHYSRRGPNAIDASDDDEDGVPDRAEDAAEVGESALGYYAWLGFAPPVEESEVGLDAPGGSDALDIYFVDLSDSELLAGNAIDACDGERCATYVVAQCDEEVLAHLVSHELFHAVQASYDAFDEPLWLLEGSADFASDPYVDREGVMDDEEYDGQPYLSRADCGLASIEDAEAGGDERCANAAYGSSLLWWYLEAQVGDDILLRTIEATVAYDGLDALQVALAGKGAELSALWPGFAAWNLRTGPRVGWYLDPGEGYSWGFLLDGVQATAEGEAITNASVWAPLSARYFRVDHAGGDLWIATSGQATPLVVTVHPVLDHGADGPIAGSTAAVGLPSNGRLLLGEYEAGGVWLSISHPDPDADSVTATVCIGSESALDACAPTAGGCRSAGGAAWLGLVAAGLARRSRQKPGPPVTSQATSL